METYPYRLADNYKGAIVPIVKTGCLCGLLDFFQKTKKNNSFLGSVFDECSRTIVLLIREMVKVLTGIQYGFLKKET